MSGPGVGAVAIIAKAPSSIPADYLILQRRAQEDLRRTAVDAVESNKKFDLKCKWEHSTDGKVKATAIKRRVQELMDDRKRNLRERQLRLRAQLEHEQEEYIQEIAALEETPLEREARMRERVRQLKEAREAERTELANGKLEQHFLLNCEQLRTLKSKEDAKVVTVHRDMQIKQKEEIRAHEKEVEKLFAGMWEQDRLAKDQRAQRDEAARRERAANQGSVLAAQMAALEESRYAESLIKSQQEQMRLAEEAARADEENRQQQLAVEKRRAEGRAIARQNRAAMREQQKRMEEEQALDMRLLDVVLSQHDKEQQDGRTKKVQMAQEAAAYRAYLAEQAAERARMQTELDALYEAEAQKAWERRATQWARERAARESLMQEVIATRREQILAKQAFLAMQREEAEEESAQLVASIALLKAEEDQKEERARVTRKDVADALHAQIEENAAQRAQRKMQEAEEAERLIRGQQLVDSRTQRALSGYRRA